MKLEDLTPELIDSVELDSEHRTAGIEQAISAILDSETFNQLLAGSMVVIASKEINPVTLIGGIFTAGFSIGWRIKELTSDLEELEKLGRFDKKD